MQKIKLKNFGKCISVIGFFNFLIEHFIFFRWTIFGYKNQLNNNFRIFSNLASTAMICLFTFYGLKSLDPNITIQSILYKSSFQNSVNNSVEETRGIARSFEVGEFNTEVLLLIFAILGAFFWDSRATYVSKWSYLAGLYNDVIKEKNKKIRKSLNLALAQDLVRLGFYQHVSFYSVFEEALLESHIFANLQKELSREKVDKLIKKKIKDCRFETIKDIDSEYTRERAEVLLQNYHQFLLE